jgi:hypothetical protein
MLPSQKIVERAGESGLLFVEDFVGKAGNTRGGISIHTH